MLLLLLMGGSSWRCDVRTVRVGCGCCGFCRYIYIDIDGGTNEKIEKKEKKRKEKKGRIRVCGRGNKP